MKVVILAGGFGTRMSEESHLKPKPMIEIGGEPILWHIMKIYSKYGFNDFIICCGYKGEIIKQYFYNYLLYHSDVTFDLSDSGKIEIKNTKVEPWKVSVIDTGLHTMTGGRIKRIEKYIGGEDFMMTYGDGVGDVDIDALLKAHRERGKCVTITAVKPSGRFGVLDIDESGNVVSFAEKKQEHESWINGGFMVLRPQVFDSIEGDEMIFEREPMESLSAHGEVFAYKHRGFWKCMDTLSDKNQLENLWQTTSPWKVW